MQGGITKDFATLLHSEHTHINHSQQTWRRHPVSKHDLIVLRKRAYWVQQSTHAKS